MASEKITAQTPNQQIGSFIGKLLRDTFGKGPESVFVSTGHTFFTAYIRNFMSPMEKILMENDQQDTVFDMRLQLMQSLIPEIRSYIEQMTGVRLREFYFDWSFHNYSGMLMGVSSEPFPNGELSEAYDGKTELEREIVKISQQAEKVPEEIYSCSLNPKTLLIVRNGILVRIEKEFIRAGQGPLLRRVKANLEKSYLHNNDAMEGHLRKRVIDVFVDWDFERDKSLIAIVLNNKPLYGAGDRELVDDGLS